MATTYEGLKTEIADYANRSDLASVVDTFIDQAESEMQVKLKNLEFETEGTLTVTAGLATLPTGFLAARAVLWGDRPLTYVTPDRLNAVNASSPSFVNYYTIVGASMKFADDGDGSVIVTYSAKFTPLSGAATSNAILAEFPSAYLYGSLKHCAVYLKDIEASIGYQTLFDEQMKLVVKNNARRKYAGATLAVRLG